MRAAPPFQLSVRRFAVWNCTLISVSVVAMVVCSAWFVGRNDDLPPWCNGLISVALFLALVGACGALRRHPVRLRWDSQCWHITEFNRRTEEIGLSQVQVMLDAGSWLLLKFVPKGRLNPLSMHWLPVQRRGIEGQWHALRCAVYSPRPGVTSPLGLDGTIRIE
ncbi:MAG: hypothetical protein Q7U28_02040 [Aquabacterium sp.]|nr:hypothetical protein [Aquabacterium sp.]